ILETLPQLSWWKCFRSHLVYCPTTADLTPRDVTHIPVLRHPLSPGSAELRGSAENLRAQCGKIRPGGGAGGIRTLDTLLTYTHFPGERLRPLGHRSAFPGRRPALEARALARKPPPIARAPRFMPQACDADPPARFARRHAGRADATTG